MFAVILAFYKINMVLKILKFSCIPPMWPPFRQKFASVPPVQNVQNGPTSADFLVAQNNLQFRVAIHHI